MPSIQIEFSRERDGTVVTRYTRADGTATWERHTGPRADFFPIHDLIHYAVEDGLKLRNGFYPLIGAGWNIQDMDGKGPRGPLPPADVLVEYLVNLFAADLNSGSNLSAAELNAQMQAYAEQTGTPPLRAFTSGEWAATQAEFKRLRQAWVDVAPGNSLQLDYEG
jgi:hypothetical protein